jgi:hypothetical protein
LLEGGVFGAAGGKPQGRLEADVGRHDGVHERAEGVKAQGFQHLRGFIGAWADVTADKVISRVEQLGGAARRQRCWQIRHAAKIK